MNCDEYKNLITISVFGELTHEELKNLKAHLRDCPVCAAAYERAEKLSDLSEESENIPIPDKEKSWRVISSKAIKKKRRWLAGIAVPRPALQYALVLMLLGASFAAGYFFRSDRIKGNQLAQLHQEISQVREITAASLIRQESLNIQLREIGIQSTIAQSDRIQLGYLFRTLIGSADDDGLSARSEQTSPLVDLALTLVRQINTADVY